ncbi:MAG: hypothetical protein ACI9KN_002228 [Gammaproteobacteria bacterium]|jgi:hypothetical protein
METQFHTLKSLFDQLGLDSSNKAIDDFIEANRPLPKHITLSKAPFWNESQASFIEQGVADDADWAEVIDHLDAQLRH